MQPSKPFVRGPYKGLPDTPHRPHHYGDTEIVEVPVEADGWPTTQAHVRKMGSGPPLLLIHGLMTSSYSWRYAFGPLSKHFTCYAPDLPGAGRSDKPIEPSYEPAALGRWIAGLQCALDIRGCDGIGNSMGGYICMRLALDDPGALKRLLNLHSPGVPEARITALSIALSIPGSHALLRWLVHRDPLKWVHRNVHYYDESYKSIEEAHEYGDPLADYAGAQALVKYLGETMAPGPMRELHLDLTRLREAGDGFPVPLLLVYSERDPMVPPRFGDVFAKAIPDARLVRMSEASHFAHVDATDRFCEIALEFLS